MSKNTFKEGICMVFSCRYFHAKVHNEDWEDVSENYRITKGVLNTPPFQEIADMLGSTRTHCKPQVQENTAGESIHNSSH